MKQQKQSSKTAAKSHSRSLPFLAPAGRATSLISRAIRLDYFRSTKMRNRTLRLLPTSTSLSFSERMAVASTRQRKHHDAANQNQNPKYEDAAFRAGRSSTHERGTVSVRGKEMVLNH